LNPPRLPAARLRASRAKALISRAPIRSRPARPCADRPGDAAVSVVGGAGRDPRPYLIDRRLIEIRTAEGHAGAGDRGRALELLHHVAVVRIARLDALERRLLDARHADYGRVDVARCQVHRRGERRAAAGVAASADAERAR